MITLILSPRYTPDSINLRRAALENGWSVERLQSYRVPKNLETDEIALYGEALFTTIIADQLGYTLLEPPANRLTSLPFDYVKRQIELITLGEARNQFGKAAFIKPAEGKSFEAQVYKSADDLPTSDAQPDAMPVFVAEPVEWLREFRCFILERQIITLSIYSRHGDSFEDDEWYADEEEIRNATSFCENILNNTEIEMPPAFVLDVGEIADRGWAVIETNPVWASGIYGCDAAKILPVLKRACVSTDGITENDKRWQINRYTEDEV